MPEEPVITAAINFSTVISPFAMSAPITASIYSRPQRVKVTRIRADYLEKLVTKQQPASRANARMMICGEKLRGIILFVCAA